MAFDKIELYLRPVFPLNGILNMALYGTYMALYGTNMALYGTNMVIYRR